MLTRFEFTVDRHEIDTDMRLRVVMLLGEGDAVEHEDMSRTTWTAWIWLL
jgi:hypothetical protein